MYSIDQELPPESDLKNTELLARPNHPEHFEVHHENGEVLVCMSSGGECRVFVEIMAGYTQNEEEQLIASTTSALEAIDQFTDGKAADIFTGLHIRIGEDVAEGGAKAIAEENQVLLNGRKMLLSIAEMRRISGSYSDTELVDFPDERRLGGALEYTLVHEMGHVLDGRTEAGFRGKKGKNMTLSMIYRMLNNPYYCGIFEFPIGSGKWYKGAYKPLISRELFEAVQTKMTVAPKSKPGTKQFMYTKLRNLRCGGCGSGITAQEKYKQTKKYGVQRYVYYHCTQSRNFDCSESYLREEKLTEAFKQLLANITIDEIKAKEAL